MSKIGKINISIPEKVKVMLTGSDINIEGPLGKQSIKINLDVFDLKVNEGKDISISPKKLDDTTKRLWGMNRSLINNAIIGSSVGFEKILEFLNKNNNDNKNRLLLGILQFKKGDFYNAISYLIEVYEIDNQNKDCILYLGKAKLALKDYKNALVDFKNYILLEKNEEVEKLIKTCEGNLT